MTRRIKYLFCALALCLAAAAPVFADSLLDVVEAAQNAIQKKYPSPDSIARKIALEELEKIARSGQTDEQIVRAILELRMPLKRFVYPSSSWPCWVPTSSRLVRCL